MRENLQIMFHDKSPDSLGRRTYTLMWDDPRGTYRTSLSPRDGKTIGYRRGQCFRSNKWKALIAEGVEVVT